MPRLRSEGAKRFAIASASSVEPDQDVRRLACRVYGRPLARRLSSLLAEPDVFFREKSGDRGSVAGAPAVARREKQTGQTWMDGQREHGFTQWSDSRRVAGQPAQQHEQSLGFGDPLGFGRVEPVECGEVANAPGVQGEDGRGEVDAVDFGLFEFGAAAVFAFGPEANAGAGAGPAGASGPLVGGRTADPDGFPAVDSARTVVADCPGEAAVDDSGHAVDRERGLGDVRAQDDFPAGGGPQRAILFLGRQRAVERKDDGSDAGRRRRETFGEPPYLGKSREKNQQMARVTALRQLFFDDRSDLFGVGGASRGPVLHRNRVQSAVDADDRTTIEISRDLIRIESCRHDDQDQVGAHGLANLAQERECKVAIQVSFVKLIEDDGTDILQKRVSEELPGENAFGEEAQTGVSRQASFEADLETDLFSQGPAAFVGDSGGARPCCDSPWLEHDHRSILGREQTGFEDRRRHPRRFSGAWRGDQHERSPGESIDDFRKSRVNRKLVHRLLGRCWTSLRFGALDQAPAGAPRARCGASVPASIRCLAGVPCQMAVGSTLVWAAGCIGPPGLTAAAAAAFALCLPSVFLTIAFV